MTCTTPEQMHKERTQPAPLLSKFATTYPTPERVCQEHTQPTPLQSECARSALNLHLSSGGLSFSAGDSSSSTGGLGPSTGGSSFSTGGSSFSTGVQAPPLGVRAPPLGVRAHPLGVRAPPLIPSSQQLSKVGQGAYLPSPPGVIPFSSHLILACQTPPSSSHVLDLTDMVVVQCAMAISFYLSLHFF